MMKFLVAAFLIAAATMAHPAAQTSSPPSVVGLWTVTTIAPSGETTNNVEITKDGDTLHAVAKGQNGGEQVYDKAEIKGKEITLVVTINYQASRMTITYTGAVDGRQIAGDCDFGGVARGTWSAVRR